MGDEFSEKRHQEIDKVKEVLQEQPINIYKKDEACLGKKKREYMKLASEEDERLKLIVEQYCGAPRMKMNDYLKGYININSIEEAISKAITETANYKRHPRKSHPFSKEICMRLEEKLLNENMQEEMSKSKTFMNLLEIVHENTSRIKGFGILAEYDIALGIGAYLNLYPEYVYLHSGAKKGAEKLQGQRCIGMKTITFNRSKTLEIIAQYPECFNELTDYEIENLLCLYKKEFSNSAYSSNTWQSYYL